MTDNIMCPISQTPHQRTIWFLFALVMVVLTWMMFGSLFAFPINEIAGDEQDTFHDIRLITEDPLNLISNSRRMPIRPLWDVIILIVYHLGQDQAVAYHTLSIVLHLLASLFLAYTFWRLGADLELSFLSALLFLINIAHFRTVHWFINTNYILAFIVGIGMLLTWVLFLESNQKRWQISASGLLLVAVFTHPSAVAATLFCFYLTTSSDF